MPPNTPRFDFSMPTLILRPTAATGPGISTTPDDLRGGIPVGELGADGGKADLVMIRCPNRATPARRQK